MKWKKVELEIFPYDVFFFCCKEGKKVVEFAERRKWTIPETEKKELTDLLSDGRAANEGVTAPMLDEDGRPQYLIWLPEWVRGNDNESLCILGHEVIHLAMYIFEEIGYPPVEHKNDEILTYPFEYMFEWALGFFKK